MGREDRAWFRMSGFDLERPQYTGIFIYLFVFMRVCVRACVRECVCVLMGRYMNT